MDAYLLVFIFILLTFLSLKISVFLSSENNKRTLLSPILLFSLFQTIMVNIGLTISSIENQIYSDKYLIIILSTFLINIGALSVGKPKHMPIIKNFNQLRVNKNILLFGYVMTVFIISYFLKDIIFSFFQFIKEVISGNIQQGINNLAFSRKEYTFSGGISGVISELKNIILVFLTIFIFSSNFKKYIKIVVVITTSIFLLSTGQRWPIFEAILVYVTFLSYTRIIKINFTKVFYYVLIGYVVFFILSFFSPRFEMTDNFVDNLILNMKAINYRFFVSQSNTSLYIFNLIPQNLNFGFGEYIMWDFSTLLPGFQEGFATYIYRLNHYGNIGSASFSTLTLFYADFGYFSLGISFLFGVLIQNYTNYILSRSISIQLIIFHSFMVLAISTTSLGSIAGIITHGFLSGFLMFKLLGLVLTNNQKLLK